MKTIQIGIISVQGAFVEHESLFNNFNEINNDVRVICLFIRRAKQLTVDIDGIIIPGGESTTLARFLGAEKFEETFNEWINERKKLNKSHMVWGICAGLIVLSNKIKGQKENGQWKLGGLDIECERNGNGRQRESSERNLKFPNNSTLYTPNCENFKGIFIRSPKITKIFSSDVEILAYDSNDEIVAVKQNYLMATTFHPELSDDIKWHEFFIKMSIE